MKIIEITETKMDKLSEHVEQGLRHLGKAMQCIDEWMQEGGMGERGGSMGYRNEDSYRRYGKHNGGMNERYPMRGGSMGYRDEDWDDDEIDERRNRRRDSRGRYE